jgi:transposase
MAGESHSQDPHAECNKRIAELKARIAELERKLEEAIRAQKRQAAPFSKGPPQENPRKPGRKPGSAYGVHAHRGRPGKVDEIIRVRLPERCGTCGSRRIQRLPGMAQQFQEEIPRKPIVRRFDLEQGECLDCGSHVQGRHPWQTSEATGAAAVQLGPDAQAMTALMKTKLGASYGDIVTALEDFFGIALTRGGAAHIVQRVGERAKAAYEGIEVVVRRSRVVYPDETGWKVRGLLQWMWTFVARTATLFRIRDSRGHDVPEEVLGADWSGTMVHDGWRPYDFFHEATHQQCLGHLMRRSKLILETAVRGAVRFPRAVLELLKDGLALRDRRDAQEISCHGLAVATGRLNARLQALLSWRISNAVNRRFANHVAAHQKELFVFLSRPGIEATSWPADQAIRPAVVNRKVFGGNREETGARAQERLSSIAATCIQRGVAILEYLSRVLRARANERDDLACRLLDLPAPP